MRFEVDQSGKIEDTSKATIVAAANARTIILKITAREKRKLIQALRSIEFPQQVFIYKAFAALLFILLRGSRVPAACIDHEYPGHEAFIKELLLHLFDKTGGRAPHITFGFVGKMSDAHRRALECLRGKTSASIVVSAKEVFQVLYSNKKGWSSHSR